MNEKLQMLTASIKKNPVVWLGVALAVFIILFAFFTIQILTVIVVSKAALGMTILSLIAFTVLGLICVPEWSESIIKNYTKK